MNQAEKILLEEWAELMAQEDARALADMHPENFVRDALGYELQWFHKEWLEFQTLNRQSLILAPRGHGKSTICTISYPLWRLLGDPALRILIVSNTSDQACSFLREIRSQLESNPWMLARFGNLAGRPWSESQLNLCLRHSASKEANLTAMGVLGPVIARHYDMIILDDVVDEQNSASQAQRQKLEQWYYKTLLPCLEPAGEIHIVGTRYHHLDLYGRLLAGEYKNHHRIYRALRELDGAEAALWEQKFSLELLKEKRKEAGTVIFNSQYQNEVELMKGAIFKPEWIQYYSSPPLRLEKMLGIDLAISRKDSADYFALVVAGRERKSNKIFILDAVHDRLSFSRQVETALNFFRKYNSPDSPVLRVCVEANAYQEAFAQKLREAGLPVKSVTRVKDKVSRAYQLQAKFENLEILFPPHSCQDLLQELLLFPQAEHDDLFDAMEIIVSQFGTLHLSGYLKAEADVSPG